MHERAIVLTIVWPTKSQIGRPYLTLFCHHFAAADSDWQPPEMHGFFHHILYTTRKLKDQKTRQPKELRNWSGMTKRQCLHTNRTSVCWFFWFKSLVFLIKIILYNNSQFEWKLKTLVLIWSNQFKFQFDLKSINCQIDLVSILTWFNSLQLNCDDANF